MPTVEDLQEYIEQLEVSNEALKTTLESVSGKFAEAETEYIPHWEAVPFIAFEEFNYTEILVFGSHFHLPPRRTLIADDLPFIPALVTMKCKDISVPYEDKEYEYTLFLFDQKHRGSFKTMGEAKNRAETLLFGRKYLNAR